MFVISFPLSTYLCTSQHCCSLLYAPCLYFFFLINCTYTESVLLRHTHSLTHSLLLWSQHHYHYHHHHRISLVILLRVGFFLVYDTTTPIVHAMYWTYMDIHKWIYHLIILFCFSSYCCTATLIIMSNTLHYTIPISFFQFLSHFYIFIHFSLRLIS